MKLQPSKRRHKECKSKRTLCSETCRDSNFAKAFEVPLVACTELYTPHQFILPSPLTYAPTTLYINRQTERMRNHRAVTDSDTWNLRTSWSLLAKDRSQPKWLHSHSCRQQTLEPRPPGPQPNPFKQKFTKHRSEQQINNPTKGRIRIEAEG